MPSFLWQRGGSSTKKQQQESPALYKHNLSPRNHHYPYLKGKTPANTNGAMMISLRLLIWWMIIGGVGMAFFAWFIVLTVWFPNHTTTTTTTSVEQQGLTSQEQQLQQGNNDYFGYFLGTRQLERQTMPRGDYPIPQPHDTKITNEILAFLNASSSNHPQSLSQKFLRRHPNHHQLSPVLQELQNDWNWPLVHIVNTRFMQEQGNLQALGRARLHLFRTFCLPTMVHQSTQQFLWIIKTDPQLDSALLQALVESVAPYPHIYLVGSNVNFMMTRLPEGNSWRDGAEARDLLLPSTRIYTGNLTRLYQAMLQKDLQIVLETRLDADDGLHQHYLKHIQEKALDLFLPHVDNKVDNKVDNQESAPKWLYWCTRRHVEWHGGVQPARTIPARSTTAVDSSTSRRIQQQNYTAAINGSNNNNNTTSSSVEVDYYGSLLVVEHSKLCITPGITVGFGIGTDSDEVPIHAHDKLFMAIHDMEPDQACGYQSVSKCLELVEDFLLAAVRARTPTSAGMMRVAEDDDEEDTNDNNKQQQKQEEGNGILNQTKLSKKTKKTKKKPKASPLKTLLFWDILHDDFHLLREQIKFTNQYILNHLVPIAKDNLAGQCTSNHSCKKETKEKLLKIIEENKSQPQ